MNRLFFQAALRAAARSARLAPAVLALATLGLCTLAALPRAEAQRPPLGQFSVLRYYPSPGANNYFQVDGALTHGELQPAVGLQLDYAHEPFTLYDARCD